MTDPLPPREPCSTCRLGCPCKPEDGESCGHYGCPGRRQSEPSTCPGALVEIARFEASRASDRARQRILRMRHLTDSHSYARNLTREADAGRRHVEGAIAEHRPPVEP